MPAKKQVVKEEPEEEAVVEAEVPDEVILDALGLEEPLRAAAESYPSGDNSDAVKAAIRNAAHGIAHIRKVLDMNARLAER